MTEHDKDVIVVCLDLVEKCPKGTKIEMDLTIGKFKIVK